MALLSLVALAACAALFGCGERKQGTALRIYVGLPLSGPLAERGRDMQRAVELAFEQSGNAAGGRPLELKTVNIGTDLRAEAASARSLRDRRAVALIGGLSGRPTVGEGRHLPTSGVPADVLQVSPASAEGALSASPASESGGSEVSTARQIWVAPSNSALGDATAQAVTGGGADSVEWARGRLNASTVDALRVGARRAGLRALPAGANLCPPGGVARVSGVEPARTGDAALPLIECRDARIFEVDSVAGELDVPAWNGRRLVTPALAYDDLPSAGRAFLDVFEDRYGYSPDRWAIFAYEAAGLVLQAIDDAAERGGEVTRQSVRKAAFAVENRFGPVGRYDVLPDGQTTLNTVAVRELPLGGGSSMGTESSEGDEGSEGGEGTKGSEDDDQVIEARN